MIKEWLNWINGSIVILAVLLLLATAAIMFSNSQPIPILEVPAPTTALPPPAYQQPIEAYDSIAEPIFQLKSNGISVQLPDLRNVISFYGKNGRPDIDPNTNMIHLGITIDKTVQSFVPNEKIYLAYDRKLNPPRYVFSPSNAETPLWLEVPPSTGNQIQVKVNLKDENGQLVKVPENNAQFTLTEKPLTGLSTATWEIGKMRVDGTLLARQKARWFGADRFLERHGGPEFEYTIGKQRIDFGEGADTYSVFVNKDSILSWNGERWVEAQPGPETLGHPILVLKKLDDKLMNFEIWDPEGKTKVVLNLLKSNENVFPANLMSNFHFLGAKTLSQFVFEINKERMILSPKDWLLNVDKGWKKLTTPEEIDAYVDRKTTGYLFVFDAVEKPEDHQVMKGTIFNRARSDLQHVELDLQKSGSALTPQTPNKNEESGRGKENISSEQRGRTGQYSPGEESSFSDDDDDAEQPIRNKKSR